MSQPSGTRKRLFQLILVLVVFVFTEVCSYLVLQLAGRFQIQYSPIPAQALYEADQKAVQTLIDENQKSYLVHHPVLGWAIRPNAQSANGQFHSNSQGLRGRQDYSKDPASGKLRISAYGDSFTHGDEVSEADTWEEQLEKLNPKLEVINFGVGGYGPDQALLRYEIEKKNFKSQIVFLGFMSENLNRVVNVFRGFYTPQAGMPMAKPRYQLSADQNQISLIPNPLSKLSDYEALLREPEKRIPEIGSTDYWYNLMPHQSGWDVLAAVRLYKVAKFWFDRGLASSSFIGPDGVYRSSSEALRIVELIFDRFHQQASQEGVKPVIVLFPSHRDILRFRKNGKRRYQALVDYLKSRNFQYIDLLDGFERLKGTYQDGPVLSHYTPEENRVVAQTISDWINSDRLASGSADAQPKAAGAEK